MAIKVVTLPFDAMAFVCDVCGFSSVYESQLERCRKAGEPEPSPITVGQVVTMYWRRNTSRGWVRTEAPEQFTVSRLSYVAPRDYGLAMAFALASAIGGKDAPSEEPTHQLSVQLAQNLDGTPWTPDSSGRSFLTLSLNELLLWQEGDLTKLAAAGLVRAAAPYGILSGWKAKLWN